MILPALPLKPPFFLLSSALRLIVRDRHDKKLLIFLIFFLDRSSLVNLGVLFFCPLSAKYGHFLFF